MLWTELDTWIVVVGALSAMACALPGCFLVLRRLSMMGDALSHAVLPGLAIAFLVTHSRDNLPMFIGAVVIGVLTACFIQWIHTAGKVEESASMGVVFTVLFAIGLILIVRATDDVDVDLDPSCVLYGAIELVPLDTVSVFGVEVPRAALTVGAVLLFNVLAVALLYKELRIAAFDPALATAMGMNARLLHIVLMVMVAITTVAAFESVGSILVIAMLIVPAAAAHILTDRYLTMLILSVVIGGAAAVLGHVSAITVPTWFGFADTSTAGMMAVMAGLLFSAAVLLAPRHGVISRALHRLRLALRIEGEDALGLLYRLEESPPAPGEQAAVIALLNEARQGRPIIRRLAMLGLGLTGKVARAELGYALTDTGRERARHLVRSHRLWESYIARNVELPTDHLHQSAARTEHYITPAMREAMAVDLKDATTDPHGRAIPQDDAEHEE